MPTYGADPHPQWHDVHAIAGPDYLKSVYHGKPPAGWKPNFAQTKASTDYGDFPDSAFDD